MSDTQKPSRRGFQIPLIPKLVLTLTLAGLLSGLALVAAYEFTLPTIEANKAAALKRAVFLVVPGAAHMQRLAWRGDKLTPAEDVVPGEEAVYAAYDSTEAFVGYAIPADGPGFQDTIALLYGLVPGPSDVLDGHIVGLQILESRETPGLGDKIFKDAAFQENFKRLAIKPEVLLVGENPENPNEVDAITGATISSRAVVKILNGGNAKWVSRLPAPGQEPPLPASGRGGEQPTASGSPATQGGDGA